MGSLLIGIEPAKKSAVKSGGSFPKADDPMGDPADAESKADDSSEFEASASEMFDAWKAGDKTTAMAAFSAAVAAKVASIVGDEGK